MTVHAQDQKVEILIAPTTQTIASNASTYGYIDTIGWNHMKVVYVSAVEASSTAAALTLKFTEGTNSTAASAIVALTGGTATSSSVGFVIPIYATDGDGGALVFDIDLRKRERYLRLHTVPGTNSTFSAVALLSRGEQVPGADEGSADLHIIA